MTFKEANERIQYLDSPYYGYEFDPELYETKEEYEKEVADGEAKNNEAWDTFGIEETHEICEHCHRSGVCAVTRHTYYSKSTLVITACKQFVSDEIPDPREDEYTKDWTYEDWSKGR
jgi:hypothetical protein